MPNVIDLSVSEAKKVLKELNLEVEVCGAMVKENGYFICLRGKDGLQEIDGAKKAIGTMGFKVEKTFNEALFDGSSRVISYFKKINKTDKKYPRKYSIIKVWDRKDEKYSKWRKAWRKWK